MTIPYENFEQYLTHFFPIVVDPKASSIDIMLTDHSPYGKMVVRYKDIHIAEDSETISFQYDIIKADTDGDFTSKEAQSYFGDLLVTIIIQSLNNIEEQNASRNDYSIEPNNE